MKATCPHGHPYDYWNTYIQPDGYYRCRICMRTYRARDDGARQRDYNRAARRRQREKETAVCPDSPSSQPSTS